jgi:hypothetical protein
MDHHERLQWVDSAIDSPLYGTSLKFGFWPISEIQTETLPLSRCGMSALRVREPASKEHESRAIQERPQQVSVAFVITRKDKPR